MVRSLALVLVATLLVAACSKQTCEAPVRVPNEDARVDERPADWTPDFTLEGFTSELPILVIETGGTAVVDEPKVTGTLWARSRDDGEPNSLADLPTREESVGIELRGQARALMWPKKQFNLEVRDGEGADLPVALLGMEAGADWVLNGTSADPTRIRNHVGYALARSAGLDAPQTRPVEVFLDVVGEPLAAADYRGLYMVTEKIQRGRGIMTLDPADGFILELTERETVWADEPWLCTPVRGGHAVHIWPRKSAELTETRRNDITARIGAVEEALYGEAWSRLEPLIDVDAFVDYWLFNALSANPDGFRRSFYVHLGPGGRLRPGPVWDLDVAFGLGALSDNGPNGEPTWILSGWGEALLEHAPFRELLAPRWVALRDGPWASANLSQVLDEAIAQVEEAARRDLDRWGIVFNGTPQAADPGELESALDVLRNALETQAAWIDASIGALERRGGTERVAPGEAGCSTS